MNITDKIIELEAAKREVAKKNKELQSIIQEELGEQFMVCESTLPDYTQLWLDRKMCSCDKALKILQDIADNGEMQITHEDAEYTHYAFWIDRSKFVIVLDKED